MIYPNDIERKIGFTDIRQHLLEACRSTLGREQVDAISFSADPNIIHPALAITREMQTILSHPELAFPRGEIHDVREALHRIRIEGLYLDEAELLMLSQTLAYAAELEHFFCSLDPKQYTCLSALSADSGNSLSTIIRLIDGVLDRYGRLSDHASPELHRIRHEISLAQGSVGRILSSILRQAQADGLLDKDVTPTLREGRLVLPIPPAYKRKIGGIVHDESATGKTVFIEPQQVVEANNRIRELEGEEMRERIRILQELTAKIRPAIPDIIASETMLGTVDFLLAKCHLADELHAIVPEIKDYPMIDWYQARHPLLYLNFKRQGREVVPLTLRLTDKRILIISGPNAGGKSVCLKTVVLLQYMLQCGLPVPLGENSVMGLFDNILIDIGDEQSIEDDLSTYSSHLRNMKQFVYNAGPRTLFLIDEFGTGTEPLIGGAIAEAVLTHLNDKEAYGVITTHYTNLKHFAEEHRGVVNGAMLYDRGALRPLFMLSIGQAGSSFAIEIARQTGLPISIINHATELIGAEHIDYDKQLQDIARDKRYWENKRQHIREREKHLEERIAYYEQEISTLKVKHKQIIAEANEKAAALLSESNAAIERTIREIKEAKADKERTRAARAKIEEQKTKVQQTQAAVKPAKTTQEPKQKKVLRDFRDLKPMTKDLPSQSKAVVDTIRSRKLSFSRTLDIRGMRADEALETFIAYLDDAIMVAAGEVTILHGTGTGVLKQVIRGYLNQRNRALRKRGLGEIEYHDGDVNTGGAGLTVIQL